MSKMLSIENAMAKTYSFIDSFGKAVLGLDASLRTLIKCDPITYETKPYPLPQSVVYLFSESGEPVYVGRTNNFSQRLGNHCRHGSQVNQSSLAFRLACEEVGYVRTKYRKRDKSIDILDEIPGLREAFSKMKMRLRSMDIRYVEEADQIKQALLESYAAIAFGIEHDFGTH